MSAWVSYQSVSSPERASARFAGDADSYQGSDSLNDISPEAAQIPAQSLRRFEDYFQQPAGRKQQPEPSRHPISVSNDFWSRGRTGESPIPIAGQQ